ncbi:2-oxoglutarate and iron-dependent oxygenase JMJD4-like [Cydia pomonella]|uniref:2-oxoglutarate and iron-dependent oxygenase JMJD4-like n=1 Tax=Cydia pomonella TaxID=82600 RepID=UPI002ADE1F59|nr:2-oxoglutarate and iron-dependent oxygenase JMJD4-like [Cydia pomonella]
MEIEINECLDNTHRYKYAGCDISILPKDIEYSKFYKDYIYNNLPCIIRNISSNWECSTTWVKDDTINYNYFIDKYSDLYAPVADCGTIAYNAQSKNDLKITDYMTYLKTREREKLLYLKDWHLRRLCPDDNFYDVPIIFGSDWLNEYAQDHQEDDYMFVYIGPSGSWTPLHADVYSSFSWSVNVVGRKKWILFPPGEEEKLKDHLGNLPLMFEDTKFENVTHFKVIQQKGDAIFVPSGWHHQVSNELDTISINQNWINACNIEEVWKALEKCLLSVEHEIKEFQSTPEFASQCQLILKSMFGMDFECFINFICYIAKKRLSELEGNNCIVFNKYILGKNHIMFDLKKLLKIIDLFNNHLLIVNNSLNIDYKYDTLTIKQQIINNVQ